MRKLNSPYFSGIFVLLLINNLFCQVPARLLKGYVIDNKTNERINNASILIVETGTGTVTNEKGYFEIKLLHGHYTVQVSTIGYQKLMKEIFISENDEEKGYYFELSPAPITLNAVTVLGNKNIDILNRGIELLPGELKNIPQFGEPDPLRAILSLPGVTSSHDLSSQLFFRGGNFDETLISLDGVPLYNPYHLGGIYSSVNNDIIKKETVHLSHYPLSMGGYLSGSLELESLTGDLKIPRYSASLSLISSKGMVQTPLGKGSLIFASRRTYFDLLGKIIQAAFPYYFFDTYAKYVLPLDDKNLLSFSALYTKDVYDEDLEKKVESPNWGNILLTADWVHLISHDTELKIKGYLSESYFYAESGKAEDRIYADNRLYDITLRTEFNSLISGHYLNSGIEMQLIGTDYLWDIGTHSFNDLMRTPEEVYFDYAPASFNYKRKTYLSDFFITDKFNLTDKLETGIGIRGSYIEKTKTFLPSASLNLQYSIFPWLIAGFNYGRYYQYLYTIKERRTEDLYAPFSVYFLPASKDDISNSDHYSLSLETKSLISIKAEVYYKNRKNIHSSYSTAPRYTTENGYAAGFDFLLKKETGDITGSAGYSFSRSVKRGRDYDYFSAYDRTHSVKFLFSYKLFENWKLSTYWTYSTGGLYTEITGKYLGGEDYKESPNGFNGSYALLEGYFFFRPLEGQKNGKRLPPQHRLDIGINGSLFWRRFMLKPYLQILNLYSSPNPYYYHVDVSYEINNKEFFWGSFVVPTIGVEIEF